VGDLVPKDLFLFFERSNEIYATCYIKGVDTWLRLAEVKWGWWCRLSLHLTEVEWRRRQDTWLQLAEVKWGGDSYCLLTIVVPIIGFYPQSRLQIIITMCDQRNPADNRSAQKFAIICLCHLVLYKPCLCWRSLLFDLSNFHPKEFHLSMRFDFT